ncbi:MAG: PEGA domain-containing protein [Myxococcales bacterium]|nr:PEGA domain-containing protein [Myxococcales bacterium]
MVDRRRDKTEQIPASSLVELRASRRRLAPRQDTWESEDLEADLAAAKGSDASEPSALHTPPSGKIPNEEIEEHLGTHLDVFTVERREAFLRAFAARQYARALAGLEEEGKRQPKNLSLAKEVRAIRAYLLGRIERELGGLNVKPRKARSFSTVDAPFDLQAILRDIDGRAPIERIVRESDVERLRALDFLLDLARSGYLELPLEDGALPPEPTLPPPGSLSGTRPRVDSLEPPSSPATIPSTPPAEPLPVETPPSAPPLRAVSSVPPGPVTAPPASAVGPPASARPVGQVRVEPRPARRELPALIPVLLGAVVVLGLALTVLLLVRRSEPRATQPLPSERSPTPPSPTAPAAAATTSPVVTTAASGVAPVPAPETVHVKIEVEPKYARVTLDGVLLTGKPIEVDLPKGAKTYVLQVESEGFRAHKATFTAEANSTFTIALERLPARQR